MNKEEPMRPLAVELCAVPCPFPEPEWNGRYDHALQQWVDTPASDAGKTTREYTTSGTTGAGTTTQDYDDDDENDLSDD